MQTKNRSVLVSTAVAAFLLLALNKVDAQEQGKVGCAMRVQHDSWQVECIDGNSINIKGGMGVGYRGLGRAFPVGHKYRVTGKMGWAATLEINAEGEKSISDVKAGPHLSDPPEMFISDDGAFQVQFGRVPEFRFRIPTDWGPWKIDGAYDNRPGYRWIELPDGTWTVEGNKWSIPLRVANGKLQLAGNLEGLKREQITFEPETALTLAHRDVSLEPAAAPEEPLGFVTRYKQRQAQVTFDAVHESPVKLHGQTIEISDGVFVGAGRNKNTVLLVEANRENDALACTTEFVSGGKNWSVTGTLTPLDPSCPVDTTQVQLEAGDTVKISPETPSGGYLLKAVAEGPDGEASCTARTVVAVEGQSNMTGSLWLPEGREAYRADEKIDVYAWQAGSNDATLTARREGAGEKVLARNLDNGLIQIPRGIFSPGDVELELKAGKTTLAKRTITILPNERYSNFLIMAYGRMRGEFEKVEKLANLGVTGLLMKGRRLGKKGRLDPLSRGLAQSARWLPTIGPADRYAPRRDKFMEFLDRKQMRAFPQWQCAHQPWGYGITFGDHIVVNRVAAISAWMTMGARQHPSFMGINMFDEAGTPRGPHQYDDGTYIEYDNFEKDFGRPKPKYYGQDTEAARAWLYDKQRQHHNIYAATGELLNQINRFADPGSFAYLGTQNGNANSMGQDGGHGPIAYKSLTLSTRHYYPGYFWKDYTLLGNEYHFMLKQDIEFRPLIWSDGDIDLTRHEVSLAVSRQVDGIAHFHDDQMIPDAYFEGEQTEEVKRYLDIYNTLHSRLKRLGGLFRTVRRDRDEEVAVLHSFYEIAPELLPREGSDRRAIQYAKDQAFTGYCAIISLLRSGIQAGWLSEEEILRENALRDREVLVLPEIKAMKPALKRRIQAFMEDGGTVFVDEGTTVKLEGAQELPFDFGKLAKNSERDTEKGSNFAPLFIPDVRPTIKENVAPIVDNVVKTSALDDLLVTRQVNGDAEYFFGVNDNMHPEEELPDLDIYSRQDLWEPLEADVTLPTDGVVYDVIASEKVANADGSAKLNVDLAPGEMCVYGVLPEAIGDLQLTTNSPVTNGQPVSLTVEIVDSSGERIEAAVPIRVAFEDSSGKSIRSDRCRSTDTGRWQGEFSTGMFDPSEVRIRVSEMLSGKTTTATIQIQPGDKTVTAVDNNVIAENEEAIGRFFRSNAVYGLPTRLNGERSEYDGLFDKDLETLYIALGNHAPDAEAVKPLARLLKAKGVDVEIRRAADLAVKGFDEFVGRGIYRVRKGMMPTDNDIEVDRPVIAIGSPQDNELIKNVLWQRRWTYRNSLGDFPEMGQAYVTHLWRPFNVKHNAIIAVANDKQAVGKAVNYLVKKIRKAYAVKR